MNETCYLLLLRQTDYDDEPKLPCRVYLDLDIAELDYYKFTLMAKPAMLGLLTYYYASWFWQGSIGTITEDQVNLKKSQWMQVKEAYINWIQENLCVEFGKDLSVWTVPSRWELKIENIPL